MTRELVLRAQAGDHQAFERLAAANARRLDGVAVLIDDRYIVGLGFDCQVVLRFPVDDPSAVQRIGSGPVNGASIQRLAP